MTRLQSQWRRLYLSEPEPSVSLVDSCGCVRALVLELARPADWERLSQLWHGVQADLDLPAPGIAVSGTDGFQLWFSLAEPVPVPEAHDFLDRLRARYLSDVPAKRLRLWPAGDPSAPQHAAPVPAPQATEGHWSAFVAPDLAAIFAETPWLDFTPQDDGQAGLLTGLRSISPAAWADALQLLHPIEPAPAPAPSPAPVPATPAAQAPPTPAPTRALPSQPEAEDAPRQFLLKVMNDETVDLALRIQAAAALLPPGR